MHIIIIEDEKPAARALQRKLEKLGYYVDTLLHSVQQAKDWLRYNPNPDLIIMDIQLSDGLSFDIFENIQVESPIIFTTAYDEYALRAFKLNSIDYLLKPIIIEELEFALEKFKNQQKKAPILDMSFLKNVISKQQESSYPSRFSLKIGQNIKIINVQDIAVAYAENRGTYILLLDGNNYLTDFKLEQLESMLNPQEFFRINRSHIIHIPAIKDILVHSNSRLKIVLTVANDLDLIVSREKVNDFKSWIG